MRRITRSAVCAVAAIFAATSGFSAATAADTPIPSPTDLPTSGQDDLSVTLPAEYSPYADVPIEIYEVATDISAAITGSSLVWDDLTKTLTVWVADDSQSQTASDLIRESGAARMQVKVTEYDPEYLRDVATELVAAASVDGTDVTWAGPAPDGSGIEIGVDAAPTAPATQAEIATFDGVPVTVVDEGGATAASRNVDASPFMAGADMIRDAGGGYVSYCTTAFAFNHYDQPSSTVTERIFTADHCTSTGQVWLTGRNLNNPTVGTSVSVTTQQNDLKALSGQDYRPYMYYGANSSNSAVAIFGYVTPIVGATICYSGAPSGTVCGNQVTNTGVTVSYSGAGTYLNLTRTVQTDGTPAVGNGDSGGPAFVIATGGYVYAAGVISGMQNAGTTCTGDASTDTRKCSATAFFAPIGDYFAFNPLDSIQTYN